MRRAVDIGLVRAHRPSPRRLDISAGEVRYLAANWGLLAELREALRTEPKVRLAALYGSVARGEHDRDSDIDLLVELADPDPRALSALNVRLRRRLGRAVDLAPLDRIAEHSPTFLLEVLDDGRPIVDRDGRWAQLHADYKQLVRRSRAELRAQRSATGAALKRLNALTEASGE